MRLRDHVNTLFGVGLWLVASCANVDPKFRESRSLLRAPVALDEALVIVDVEGARAHLVPLGAGVGSRQVNVPAQPLLAVRRNGEHDEALVLSAGRAGDRNDEQEPGALTAVDAAGKARSYLLGNNPFDTLDQSADGRFAVLRRLATSDRLIKNVNVLVAIDLEADPDHASAQRSFTTPEAPQHVFFSRNFPVGGAPHALAVALSSNTITIVDLKHREREPTLVDLSTDSTRSVMPEEVLFDASNGRIYVRGAGSDDVFSLRLLGRDPSSPTQNDFSTSVDIIAAGTRPTDMQIYEVQGRTKLLVMSDSSRTATLVDVDTSRTTTIRLPSRLDHAHVYTEGEAPNSRTAALLWDQGGTDLYRIDLELAAEQRERSLERLPSLPAALAFPIELVDGRVIMIHEFSGMTLVDPVTRKVTPFTSSFALGEAFLDEARGRLWIAPEGQATVAYLNLTDGSTDELKLDSPISMVVPAFRGGEIAFVHDNTTGYVTFVDVEDPSRNTSRSVRGFMLEGILD